MLKPSLLHYLLLLMLIFSSTFCYAQDLRDPTRPPDINVSVLAENLTKQLMLSAIFYSSKHANAIINGQTLQQGDMIEGYKILQITPASVLLQSSSGTIELPLVNLVVKKMDSNGARH